MANRWAAPVTDHRSANQRRRRGPARHGNLLHDRDRDI